MRAYLAAWFVFTALACAYVFAQTRLSLGPMPDVAAARYAYAALAAAQSGEPPPAPPPSAASYRGSGPVFVSVYAGGELRARHVGRGSLADVIAQAAKKFRATPELLADREHVRFRVAVTRGRGPLMVAVPGLDQLALVPLRDGAAVTWRGRTAYVTPDDLLEHGLTDRAVPAPVPDLSFGTDIEAVRELLAHELGVDAAELGGQELQRLRIDAVPEPAPAPRVDVPTLQRAAREGAEFVLRHQARSGRFTYIYDAHRDAELEVANYSLARHAGTMFFLARAARDLDMPAARAGALRGLDYVRRNALTTCGSEDRSCVTQRGRVEFGGSALTALACAELLRGGADPFAQRMLRGLLEFLRAQQRPDGELMHEYSLELDKPIDVQRMYYSGEAAMALLAGYEQLHDPRDLEAARRLMAHLTGGGWSFFGARYYYGEEHWTCQAVAKAAAHLPVDSALDFCLRWGRWQENLQYRAGQTPWPVEGAFGVGPVLLPRVTTAASRVEALVPIYRIAKPRGFALASTRALIERSLGLLLRMRWAPGPSHLFAQPSAAVGGVPSTAADLRSRVDMVQHAGSAMLAWAELLAAQP
jgi:hypothetical protein